MSKELDEKLKKALGSARPLDAGGLTNRVMEHLREELRKEGQPSFLRGFFRRMVVFARGALMSAGSGRFAQAGQTEPFARKYAVVLKITAGLAAVIVISTLIFIRNYGPSTSVEQFEYSQVSTKLNNTLPTYVLNERIDVHIEETRPCDILPPLSD